MQETNEVARITPEGFIELLYSENIDVMTQNKVLKRMIELANEANLLESGLEVIIDATKTKNFTPSSSAITSRAAETLKINHVAVFGTPESIEIMKEMAKGYPRIIALRNYFPTREEAIKWIEDAIKNK